VVYLAAVFLGGALAAPWLYHAVHAAAETFPVLQPIAAHSFALYLSRAWLLAAGLGLWPLLRAVGMNTWPALGLARSRGEGRRLVTGLGLALALSVGVFALASVAGARQFASGWTGMEFGVRLLKAGQAAVFVGVIEELLFRGALLGILRRCVSWPLALGLSSVFYAMVHFLGRAPEPETVGWASGLTALSSTLSPAGAAGLTPAFLNLALAGLILGVCWQRTGSLFFPIGLHGGWILGLKLGQFLTRPLTEPGSALWGWGLVDGWFVFSVLGVLWVVCLRSPRPGARTEGTSWQGDFETG
jgi:membrane protease YdiL (CAAX protease family)